MLLFLFSREVVWDQNSFSDTDTVNGLHDSIKKGIDREYVSNRNNLQALQDCQGYCLNKTSRPGRIQYGSRPNKPDHRKRIYSSTFGA